MPHYCLISKLLLDTDIGHNLAKYHDLTIERFPGRFTSGFTEFVNNFNYMKDTALFIVQNKCCSLVSYNMRTATIYIYIYMSMSIMYIDFQNNFENKDRPTPANLGTKPGKNKVAAVPIPSNTLLIVEGWDVSCLFMSVFRLSISRCIRSASCWKPCCRRASLSCNTNGNWIKKVNS